MTQNPLGIIVYAPALVSDDKRPLAIVHGMERAFPGLRLEWTVSDEHQLVSLPQRDSWLFQEMANGGFPLLCNRDESYPVTVFGLETPSLIGPGGQPLFHVHAQLPRDATVIAAAAALLEAIAEGAHALWGEATPFNAGVDIAEQTFHPHVPEAPPRGLPALKEKVRAPEIPQRLGWLNYWSAAAAQVIGFPDPSRDAELLSRARRTVTGGWIVSLTEKPLDLDDPAHLDALMRAYDRFPVIGGRSHP